jgi:hypothetical protein
VFAQQRKRTRAVGKREFRHSNPQAHFVAIHVTQDALSKLHFVGDLLNGI